jgi:hypothetical protein
MRSKKQVSIRQERANVANRLLAWFKGQSIIGACHTYPYLKEFSEVRAYPIFTVWKAWDLLKEAGRLSPDHGHGWKVLDFTFIAIDDNGDPK